MASLYYSHILGISVIMGVSCDSYDRYCKSCVLEKPSRTITLKPPARKSSRKRTQLDYANLNSGVESDPSRWLRVIQSKPIEDDEFKRMKGSDVGIEWLENDQDALKEPIVIESPEGLGMKMPDENFTVSDVADVVGHETPVEVIGAVADPRHGFPDADGLGLQMSHLNQTAQAGLSEDGPSIITRNPRLGTRSGM
jgi:hypothetical protein